jgi:hypothetical protein
VAKNGRKVKAIALLYLLFLASYFKNEISVKKWTKSKGFILTFLLFLASFSKMK